MCKGLWSLGKILNREWGCGGKYVTTPHVSRKIRTIQKKKKKTLHIMYYMYLPLQVRGASSGECYLLLRCQVERERGRDVTYVKKKTK